MYFFVNKAQLTNVTHIIFLDMGDFMEILNLEDDIFFDFAASLDKDNIRKNNSKLVRKKDYVQLFSNPHPERIKQDYDVDRVFTFTNNLCYFEYCCIRLDFSLEWKNFMENLNAKKDALAP